MHFTPDTAQHSGQAEVTTSAVTGDPATTPAKVPTTGAPHFPHSGGIMQCVTRVFVSGCTWSCGQLQECILQLRNWLVINSLKVGRPASKADMRYINEERLCLLCITPEKEFMWRMQADHLLAIFASVCSLQRSAYPDIDIQLCIRSTGQPAQCLGWVWSTVNITTVCAALNGRKGRVVGTVDILQFPRNQNWTSEMGEVR